MKPTLFVKIMGLVKCARNLLQLKLLSTYSDFKTYNYNLTYYRSYLSYCYYLTYYMSYLNYWCPSTCCCNSQLLTHYLFNNLLHTHSQKAHTHTRHELGNLNTSHWKLTCLITNFPSHDLIMENVWKSFFHWFVFLAKQTWCTYK